MGRRSVTLVVAAVVLSATPAIAGKGTLGPMQLDRGQVSLWPSALTDKVVNRWLEKENLVFTKVKAGYWALDFEGDNFSPITLMVQLRRSQDDDVPTYVTFWALMQILPKEVTSNATKMAKLTRELLDIGFNEYLVKMVIDEDVQVGVQAELPAEGLTYDAFIKTLWKVVNVADDQYPEVQSYIE